MFPLASVVDRLVSETFSTLASISGLPSKSTRRNRIPVFGGAGSNVMLTRLPLCNPVPEKFAGRLTVCCCNTVRIRAIVPRIGKRPFGYVRRAKELTPFLLPKNQRTTDGQINLPCQALFRTKLAQRNAF